MKMGKVQTATVFTFLSFFLLLVSGGAPHLYTIDDSVGLGRRFDGVGAISGGGATSKLLINYPKQQQSEILDFLFKPNFGASLQILKVEIGGDAESTEGTESSHMHEPWDENYQRGYEWWLMKEAKKRNPSIKLYGLPWGYPGWLGRNVWWPFTDCNRTAMYVTKWILGAKKYHGLDIDYIGIWNEKPYDPKYIPTLRHTLDNNDLRHVMIVAADLIGSDAWDVVKDMKSQEFNDSIVAIGGHYTGTYTTDAAQTCGKPLWSTEDWSWFNTEEGGGCMPRVLNQNYINGYMTNLIAWNLIYSYLSDLPITRHGLMTANQPWSGYYEVNSPIWGTAHTTQFTEIGWYYLSHGSGVGFLKQGGSYVSYVSPNRKQFTLHIETMNTAEHDFCLRVPQGGSQVYQQNATFTFAGTLGNITELHLWVTNLGMGLKPSTYFKNAGKVKVISGQINLHLEVNSIYTLSTVTTATKGSHPTPPKPADFPTQYKDNFDNYPEFSEAYNFAQQVGVWEIRQTTNNKVYRQIMINPPVHWCPLAQMQPITVIGNYSWSDVHVQTDILVPGVNSTRGVFIAARVDQGGCQVMLAKGVYVFFMYDEGQIHITTDLSRTETVTSIPYTFKHDTWYTMAMVVKGSTVTASINNKTVFQKSITMTSSKGFVAMGTDNFGLADFDNFRMSSP